MKSPQIPAKFSSATPRQPRSWRLTALCASTIATGSLLSLTGCGAVNGLVAGRNSMIAKALAAPGNLVSKGSQGIKNLTGAKTGPKQEKELPQNLAQWDRIKSGREAYGHVTFVDTKNGFVLVRSAYNKLVTPGSVLQIVGPLGAKATLKASPEIRRNLIALDITSGSPALGDTVYLSQATQARTGTTGPRMTPAAPAPAAADLPPLSAPSDNEPAPPVPREPTNSTGDSDIIPGPPAGPVPNLPEIPQLD